MLNVKKCDNTIKMNTIENARILKKDELMVGNYCLLCEDGNKLNAVLHQISDPDEISYAGLGELYGLPISVGFLVDWFGFRKNNIEYIHDDCFFGLYYDEVHDDWHVYECRDNFHLRTINYIHELQNLFFWFTCKKLQEKSFACDLSELFGDHSWKEIEDHNECVNCGSENITITDSTDICHECGYKYE